MKVSRFTLLSILTALAFSSAFSSSNSIQQYNNSAGFAIMAQNMHYEETSFTHGGVETILDSNKGTVAGADVFVRHQFGIIYTEFSLAGAQGMTPYNGFSQNGNTPINSDLDPSFFLNGYGAFGIIFHEGNYFALIPYGLVGYHRWGRSNLPNQSRGDHEDYQNNYYGYGIRLELLIGNAFIVSVYGNNGKTFSPEVYSPRTHTAAARTVPVGATFKIQTRPWATLGVNFDVAMFQQLHAFATVEYTRFSYGASLRLYGDGSPGSGSDEPDSKTRYWVAMLGLAYDELTAENLAKFARQVNSIRQVHNQAGLAFFMDHQIYTLDPLTAPATRIDGREFNQNINTGEHQACAAPGGIIDVTKMFGPIFLRTLADYTYGHARFTSNVDPQITTASANIKEYKTELSVGYLGEINSQFGLFPYFVGGFETQLYMIRLTQFTIPENNIYSYLYAGLGLGVDWRLCKRLILEPSFAGGWTFNNEIFVPIARINFTPVSAGWYQAGFKVDFALTRTVHVDTSVAYRRTNFSQSPQTFINNSVRDSAILPKSKIASVLFTFGVSYQLPEG